MQWCSVNTSIGLCVASVHLYSWTHQLYRGHKIVLSIGATLAVVNYVKWYRHCTAMYNRELKVPWARLRPWNFFLATYGRFAATFYIFRHNHSNCAQYCAATKTFLKARHHQTMTSSLNRCTILFSVYIEKKSRLSWGLKHRDIFLIL